MSVQVVNKKVYRCTCEWLDCQKTWDAETTDEGGNKLEPPKRCSRCKRYSWNLNPKENPHLSEQPKKAVKKSATLPKPKRVRSYDE